MKLIYIVGPDRSMPGGILEVIEQIVKADIELKDVIRKHVATASRKNKILTFIKGYGSILMGCLMRQVILVHINMSEGGSLQRTKAILNLCSLFNIKTIIHSHGSELEKQYKTMTELQKRNFKISMSKANIVIALTPGWKIFWKQIVPESKIRVLPNGVVIRDEVIKKYKINGKLNILFLGFIGKKKGTYELIDAVKRLTEKKCKVNLDIAGNGEIEKCKRYVLQHNLEENVNVLGWANEEMKEYLFEKADILVLPSHYESFGIVVLEAMGRKLPVICGDSGYTKEIIQDGRTGYVARSGDVEDIAKKIELLNDIEILNNFGENAYQLVLNNYSIDTIMKKLQKIYEEII